MQITAAVLAILLALSASSSCAARTLLAADSGKVQMTSGAVSSDNMAAGVPRGRECVATGMHCSSSSQCCSKSCNTVYFRCG